MFKYLFYISLLLPGCLQAQQVPWHGKERVVHYRPDGTDFLKVNGTRRFNRALYGTNTAFRVEAGDLPEFALYLPGMGGNFKIGLWNGRQSKWITTATGIQTIYRPGEMVYTITDPLLDKGRLVITVIPGADDEAMLVRVIGEQVPGQLKLVTVFGGVSGKRFSRDGDIGADPESSFYLQPGYCINNLYKQDQNNFTVYYSKSYQVTAAGKQAWQRSGDAAIVQKMDQLEATWPAGSSLQLADATALESPQSLWASPAGEHPVMAASVQLHAADTLYYRVSKSDGKATLVTPAALPELFAKAENVRRELVDRVQLETPDAVINTLAGALAVAGDAIWEYPTYLHGAVAWRMRLNAWRGAYIADPLGWHDRAKAHFSSYAKSQVTTPPYGPVVADTGRHLARQLETMGTSMFSSGYICRNPNGDIRPHHYDMNLVFIDQLLHHFNWTGDTAYVREMWPVIERHLAWEKRNFDTDDDGLYDAYCCIWASDALQYSGGGVTHSSAYNYRANLEAAKLAALIGKDPAPYRAEAAKILAAINRYLWLPQQGSFAEYKDRLGMQAVHPAAGLWTIYHALDEGVPDAFEAWQSLRYVDNEIPHIPVQAKGMADHNDYLLSTTNWQPYTWSVNNVALAENLHMALAYWQGGETQEAYRLWRSALYESMYLGASPGGFQQLSFYDAMRGELYRDFADPIGMAGRSLVEGLFGIQPQLLEDSLLIKPGFPEQWDHARLQVPDITLSFKRSGLEDRYEIQPHFAKPLLLELQVRARTAKVKAVLVNGRRVAWNNRADAVGAPVLVIHAPRADHYEVRIIWKADSLISLPDRQQYTAGDQWQLTTGKARVQQVYDPQGVLMDTNYHHNSIQAQLKHTTGRKTVFVQLQQGDFTWWQPLEVDMKEPVEIIPASHQLPDSLTFKVVNNRQTPVSGTLTIQKGSLIWRKRLTVPANDTSAMVGVPAGFLIPGNNEVLFKDDTVLLGRGLIQNWEISLKGIAQPLVSLAPYFNSKVTALFKQEYLSPRPVTPTLQLPWQGIGNWCYPLVQPVIDDVGLRRLAGVTNSFRTPQNIDFLSPGDSSKPNVVFTSQWDNFPDSVQIPLEGNASHAYLLMTGTTNPMQSRLVNGVVRVIYTDGTADSLLLQNPQNWWPVEQDYYEDGYAFTTDAPRPLRLYLKTGTIARQLSHYTSIKGFTDRAVEGGAATILDLPLNAHKTLQALELTTVANDVVIGLMAVTLLR